MIKLYKTLITIICFLPIVLSADTFTIQGRVTDEKTGDPLPYANIYFEQSDFGSVSDLSGGFLLSGIPFETGILVVSMMGYKTVRRKLQFPVENYLEIKMQKDLIEMSSIVVTGTRTERYLKDVPVTTQVIHGEKLQTMGGSDISKILGEFTGVAIVENQFGTGIELNGFDADHILVMVDGMRMIGRTNGQLDISQIATNQIERIEIVKGAGSALYGSEAMGGVVNIITKQPGKNITTSITGDFGSYGRMNGSAFLMGGIQHWASKVYAGFRKYGGDNVNANSLWENGSQYDKYNAGFHVEKKQLFDGIVRLTHDSFLENQILNNENIFEDVTDNYRGMTRVEYEANRSSITYTTGVEYSHYNHLYERFVISSGNKRSSDRTIDDLFQADAVFQFSVGNHHLNGGGGFMGESIESARISKGSMCSDLSYVFGQDDWEVTKRITLLSGLRVDSHSLYSTYLSPKIAIMYKPELFSRIRLSYGRGFRAPSFKELFLDFTYLQVGYHIRGNPDLEPEISNSYSLDIERWNSGRYHSRINLFYNHIHNLIDYVSDGYDELNLHQWKTDNIHRARTQGMEMDFTWFFTPNVEWAVGYSYLDSWDVDNESPINLKAKHKGNSGFRCLLPFEISMNVRVQYIGERYYGEEGLMEGELVEEWLDDYMLLHTNFSIPVMKYFELNAGVKNITDVYDEVWGPMPGREWYVGLRIKNE